MNATSTENVFRRCSDHCQRDYNGAYPIPSDDRPKCDCDPLGVNGSIALRDQRQWLDLELVLQQEMRRPHQ